MALEEISFENNQGQKIAGVIRYRQFLEPTKYPAVIILHSFAMHKNHELVATLANTIAPYGYVTLRFDFHGHGESEGEFLHHNLKQQVEDVGAAIDYLQSLDFVDPERIALIGHGMGADLAILTAAKDDRIKTLITIAARADLSEHISSHFTEEQISNLDRLGHVDHHQFGKIGKGFFNHLKSIDIIKELKEVHVPALFIHGTHDFRVQYNNVKSLYFAANEPKKFQLLDGADHDIRQPQQREEMIELMLNWLNRWLKGVQHFGAETTERQAHSRLI